MQDVVRFWLERGTDGFRLDAIPALLKDPELRDDPPARTPFPLPLHPEHARLAHVYSANRPDVGEALAEIRRAAGDAVLIGEAYVPTADLPRYLTHVDLAFAFEFLHAPWEAGRLRVVIEDAAALAGVAWVLSNHDFPRVATRFGEENARAAAVLLLTLPGAAFVYQGDELGLVDGPGADPPYDRAGRDGARHPMHWDGTRHGGFTTGEPWLPAVDPADRNAERQRDDPGSLLNLYRGLIALRRCLRGALRFLPAPDGVLLYERGRHVVAVNVTAARRPLALAGRVVLATDPSDSPLAPHSAIVVERD
jgi:alpha-glucosidase